MGFVKKLIKYSSFGLIDLDDSPAPAPDPVAIEEEERRKAKEKAAAHQGLVDAYGRSGTFKTGTAGLVTDPRLKKKKLLGG